jgi:hypothetical protein
MARTGSRALTQVVAGQRKAPASWLRRGEVAAEEKPLVGSEVSFADAR